MTPVSSHPPPTRYIHTKLQLSSYINLLRNKRTKIWRVIARLKLVCICANFYLFLESKRTIWQKTLSVGMTRSTTWQRRSGTTEQLGSSWSDMIDFCLKTFLLSCTKDSITSWRRSSCQYKTTPMAGTGSCKYAIFSDLPNIPLITTLRITCRLSDQVFRC